MKVSEIITEAVKQRLDPKKESVAEGDDLSSMSHREFKRREMELELGHEDTPEFKRMMRDADRGPWYIKIDGKIFKQKGEPKMFDWKKGANNYALAILKNKPELQGKITLTKRLLDENEGVQEGIGGMIVGGVGQFFGNKIDPLAGEIMRAHGEIAGRKAEYTIRKYMHLLQKALKQQLDSEENKGVREASDWGEPREILEDVLQTLEREVEWPLTEVMDPKEVKQLLSPLVRAVNDKMMSMDGMKALAKAGREDASEKELDNIRDQHDKYDESIVENIDELARVLELSGLNLTADEQFDIIEDMVESLAEAHGVDAEVIWEDFESVDDNELLETAAWRRKEGKSDKGGLNAKGVASYRRENPGSKLQTAVTTKPSKLKPGSKAAKRRKSFCARMGGVKGPMKKPNGKPTRKALALRKWNC